jgi:hypothetical protein
MRRTSLDRASGSGSPTLALSLGLGLVILVAACAPHTAKPGASALVQTVPVEVAGRTVAPPAANPVSPVLQPLAPAEPSLEISQLLLPSAPSIPPGAIRIALPYYSQLDDTPWADANCGPTALSMGLGAFGIDTNQTDLRDAVLDAQQIWGDDAGTFIWALAAVADAHGVRALDLNQNGRQKRWSVADVRAHVEAGHPVLLQVRYRALPGREEKLYWGDHYIIVSGLTDDGVLYSDPIDNDGPGYDRLMSNSQLATAMNAADRRYVFAGFAFAPRT